MKALQGNNGNRVSWWQAFFGACEGNRLLLTAQVAPAGGMTRRRTATGALGAPPARWRRMWQSSARLGRR
jgi:hypothetical protein